LSRHKKQRRTQIKHTNTKKKEQNAILLKNGIIKHNKKYKQKILQKKHQYHYGAKKHTTNYNRKNGCTTQCNKNGAKLVKQQHKVMQTS
jgi:hypothetical protein